MKQYLKKSLNASAIFAVMVFLAAQYRLRAELPVDVAWLAKSAVACLLAGLLSAAFLHQWPGSRPKIKIPVAIVSGAGFLVTAFELKQLLFEPEYTASPTALGVRLLLAVGVGSAATALIWLLRRWVR